LIAGGVWWFNQRAARTAAATQTAEVTTVTAVTRVESSGAIQPLQTASLAWKTTGQVARVNVQPGDRVRAGDVLMELDSVSAPANIIQAQADLISAQKNLDDLLHPSEASVANARKAVADAQSNLDKAERALRNLQNPNLAYYEDQVRRAEAALAAAQQNAAITDFAANLSNAQTAFDDAKSNLENVQELERNYPGAFTKRLENAQKSYDRALQDLQTAQMRLEQSQNNDQNALKDAQDNLTKAQNNLAWAQAGPEAVRVAQAEADAAVAQAALSDAQETLAQLLSGADPTDIAAAEARVLAAQANVNALRIVAPFDGEVLAVNYLPGDLVDQSQAAVVVANRTQLHVDVPVDETEVARIQTGDAVSITLDALSGMALTGVVDWINPVGQAVQGVVKYTVRVNLQASDSVAVLLGATANTAIVTDVQTDVLAVPLDAIQSDAEGEFVNRVNADGTRARVNVTSGSFEGDLVTIAPVNGGLQKGDKVEVAPPQPTQFNGPFGGN
jgi:HlyD family secretion protein